MNYRGHLVGGALAFSLTLYILVALGYSFNSTQKLIFLIFCLIGSLFPDIDTKSVFQLWIYRILFVCYLLLFYLNPTSPMLIIIAILALFPLIVRHRTLFHRSWFLLLYAGLGALILSAIDMLNTTEILGLLFFLIGAFSHLLLDNY